jgi:FtsP/CotA-like multicopper oxidase with cupredoxin domain
VKLSSVPGPSLSRRALLLAGSAAAASTWLPRTAIAGGSAKDVRITAAPGKIPVVGPPYGETEVWAYNGQVPGPEIRVRQGGRLRITVENGLSEDTTVHWHGLRVPNAMDGVPHLTQAPIKPGESFTYEFDVPDAGTFWYHPHQRSFEQVERGLAGPLIIEEREPIQVDRDITWVLDDWRLKRDASISDDFANMMDASHSGRLGNTLTINGRMPSTFPVRAGERIRLRLINAANARIFGLEFERHQPKVIALDGHPVAPHDPDGGRIVLGPAMRADLILDMTGQPGERFAVADTFYRGREYRVVDVVYGDEPLRDRPLDAPIALAANPVSEPDLSDAVQHDVTFGGGMMGMMSAAVVNGQRMGMLGMMRQGIAWAINGVAATEHMHDPMLVLNRGRSAILNLSNETAWWHPIHLHGHTFRVIARNGQPTRHREWQDTVLMAPRERIAIAFVADNPGDWMIHCHVLEHQAAGMMGVIRVA